jgi:DUF971 family protein
METNAPANIRAHQSDQVVELVWDESRTDRLRYHYVRAQCPCASCRDEWTGERILDPKSIRPDLALEGMEPVGAYAVRFGWNDGHSSGLYTWEALRKLADDLAEGQAG